MKASFPDSYRSPITGSQLITVGKLTVNKANTQTKQTISTSNGVSVISMPSVLLSHYKPTAACIERLFNSFIYTSS